MFFRDGNLHWSTNNPAVPVAHPSASVLVGRQHGENWPSDRKWKPGVGDRTCFQGNICALAWHSRALSASRIRAHALYTPPKKDPPKPLTVVRQIGRRAGQDGEVEEEEWGQETKADERSLFDNRDSEGEVEEEEWGQDTKADERDGEVEEEEWGQETKADERAIAEASRLVHRSRVSAARHTPLVGGRAPAYTPFDVAAFYATLESNSVWKMTRRVFALGWVGRERSGGWGTSVALVPTIGGNNTAASGGTMRDAAGNDLMSSV
ncbi:hypothetical protein T484DRAFT_1818881 [Baffinella frigidus]|nr:hypothetical protein T484DRAFT_1818881 [Cryptophyta sp. CCMP2293]